jgi:hypothetical protein
MKYKYICYLRPGYEEQFRNIINSAGIAEKTFFISDFKALGRIDWINYFDCNVGYKTGDELSEKESYESISRCRLLRTMRHHEAKVLLNNSYNLFLKLIDKHDIKEVIGLCIDSYIGDALRLAINSRGGRYNGIVVSFIQGYFRITELGEQLTDREVSSSEADLVFSRILENKNRAHFLPQKKRNVLRRGLSEVKGLLKDLLRFQYYRGLKWFNFEDNYHVKVNALGILGVPAVLNGYDCWKQSIEDLSDAPKLYLPLQVAPEATIDYWSQSLEPINYEEFIFKLIRRFPGLNFIIKENPSVHVRRSKGFYKNLHSYKNVVCVDVNIDSAYLIKNTDATITVTGSVGVEALIQGKPCVLLGNPYYNYSQSPFFLSTEIEDLTEGSLKEFLKNFDSSDISLCEQSRIDAQKLFISFVLSGLLEGDFRLPSRSKNGKWAYDLDATEKVGIELAKALVARK